MVYICPFLVCFCPFCGLYFSLCSQYLSLLWSVFVSFMVCICLFVVGICPFWGWYSSLLGLVFVSFKFYICSSCGLYFFDLWSIFVPFWSVFLPFVFSIGIRLFLVGICQSSVQNRQGQISPPWKDGKSFKMCGFLSKITFKGASPSSSNYANTYSISIV